MGVAVLTCLASVSPCITHAYVDKVLEEGPQSSTPESRDDPKQSDGPARGLRSEYGIARTLGGGSGSTSGYLAVSAFTDTVNLGTLSASTTLRHREPGSRALAHDGRSTFWRLEQAGMPLERGWFATSAVGRVSDGLVPLARTFGRIHLPTTALEGFASRVMRHGQSEMSVHAGRPELNGYVAADTQPSASYAGLGLQGAATPTSLVAVQFAHARGLRALDGNHGSSHAAWGAWRWRSGGVEQERSVSIERTNESAVDSIELQGNVLLSTGRYHRASAPRLAGGAWIDAQWQQSILRSSGGMFYLEPGLMWGGHSLPSGVRGGYWRGEASTRQWSFSAAVESASSTSGADWTSHYASAQTRYRISTLQAIHALATFRRDDHLAALLHLGWDQVSSLGRTQLAVEDWRDRAASGTRLWLEHGLDLEADSSLNIALGPQRSNLTGTKRRSMQWALTGSTRPWPGVGLEASMRGFNGFGNNVSATVGVSWRLTPRWSVVGSYSHSESIQDGRFLVHSPLVQASLASSHSHSTRDRRFQLVLRYEERAGRPIAPLGGTPGMGGGNLVGTVYLDANSNGRRDAGEQGVAGVRIRLDGRFSVETDANGKYEFGFVAAGEHRIELVPDNVPLPWSSPQRKPVLLQVEVRGTVSHDFPLRIVH
jgi:hypothetical protein